MMQPWNYLRTVVSLFTAKKQFAFLNHMAQKIHEQRGDITLSFSLINSPLNIRESQVEPLLACIRKGLPIYLSAMPMAGLSAPYSMSGHNSIHKPPALPVRI